MLTGSCLCRAIRYLLNFEIPVDSGPGGVSASDELF